MNPVRNTMYTNVNPVVSNGVKIIIRNFQKKIPINPIRIKRTILKVLSSEGAPKSFEITVCFVNEKKIKELNKKYLGIDSATDCLAFDATNDVIVSSDAALENAKIFNTTPLFELNLYVVHGVLHLLGYNDRTEKQKITMRSKERKYVNT